MSPHESAVLRWASAWYRIFLWAYPPSFRRRYGEEMARLFEGRARSAWNRGAGALLRFFGGALRDVVVNAGAAWVELVRPRKATGISNSGEGIMGRGVLQDLSWALRTLRRSPGFTIAAVITIALGVGANTAIFSVVRAVLLQPLPYGEPQQLVVVWSELERRNITEFPLSPPDFQDLRASTPSLESLAAAFTLQQPLTGDGEPVQVMVGAVTPNLFDVLGVPPILGRTFRPEDGEPGAPGSGPGDPDFVNQAVMLDAGLWKRRFGGDPDVVGRIIDIGGRPSEVVGVMPEGFRLLFAPGSAAATAVDVWAAMRLDFGAAPRGNVFLSVIGRRAPGASMDRVQDDLDRAAAASRAVFPGWEAAGLQFEAVPMHSALIEDVRPVILALMGAVLFVLLIACANVSNLLLVRGTGRQREISIRGALGGSRGRIVRQLLTESFIIALAGAVLGILVARLGIDVLLLLRPEDLPRLENVALDGPVLAFTAASAVLAALIFGALPAVYGSRIELADALRDRGHSALVSSQRLLRNGVVVVEIALSLMLLVGAGLMVRSFVELQRVDPGFDPNDAVTFAVNLAFQRYPTLDDRQGFSEALRERLAGISGVEVVSAAFPLPLDPPLFNGRWGREEDVADEQTYRQADYFRMEPDYFEAMGTRILEGREPTPAEHADSAAVVVVNRLLAERAFPGESALGRRIHVRVSSQEPQIVEIVGVAERQRHPTLEGEGREAVYFTSRFAGGGGQLRWIVRSELDLASVASMARREVADLDPLLPVADIEPLEDRVQRSMASSRFALVVITAFGVMALILAAIGLYGVVAFTVRQRTAEIGVRMMLGAERAMILRNVVGHGLLLSAGGVGLGLLASLGLTRVMGSMLVGVSPRDPLTFAAVAGFFFAMAVLASLLPAMRATRIDPSEALRSG